jgi:hypothetical protein
MGALDDAIREHLELKRRHGASEDEIQQAEAEALGPARRSVPPEPYIDEAGMPAPPDAFEDAPPAAGDAVEDAPPPPPPGDAVEDAPPPPDLDPEPYDAGADITPVPLRPDSFTAAVESMPVEAPPVEPPPVEPPPVEPPPVEPPPVEPAPVEPLDDDTDRARTAILDDPLREGPPIHHEPDPDEPPAPARPMDEATRIRETPPVPPEGDEDDVLEETPDFLQETPEHDRLWFEQKPPRDFDFDD